MSILTFDLASGKEQPLTSRKWQSMDRLAWLPDGSGLIVPAVEIGALPTQIWFVPFPSGEPHKITSDLNNYGDLYLSTDGKSLATIQFAERSRIWIVPRGDASEGRPITAGEQEQYRALALTPDGRLVYVASTDTGRDIWLMNTDETGRVQLTKNAGNNLQPDASPDGRYIVFSSNRAGKGAFNLWRMNVDGSNPLQLTFGRGEVQPACSPDGRWVVYSQGGPDTSNESKTLWKVPIDGGHPIPLIDTPSGGAAISADGSQIATWYMQGKDSPWQIAVISSEGGPPIKVFEAKRSTPARVRWTPDGQAITYVTNRDGIANIWSQPISGGPPKPVTQFTSEQIAGFDWSAAGDLICVRHRTTRDIVLMSNFK
jgi:Tol biopolymer transport system component